jgi:hypothetical protein
VRLGWVPHARAAHRRLRAQALVAADTTAGAVIDAETAAA